MGAAHAQREPRCRGAAAGRPGEAEALLRDALARTRARGDDAGVAHVLAGLGRLATLEGRRDRAAEALEESLALRRRLGDVRAIGLTLGLLAELAPQTATATARGRCSSARCDRRAGRRPPAAPVRCCSRWLGIEPPAEARPRLEAALATADELGARRVRGWALPRWQTSSRAPTAPQALLDEARKAFLHCGDRWGLSAASTR